MRKTYVLSVLLLFNLCIYGQVDVLKFNKDEVMKGVVKGMEKGILTIKTSYSNNDFTLAWNEVESIVTETKFRVTLSEGEKYYGIIHSTDGKQVIIEDEELGSKTVDILDIVELSSVDEKFIDRFSASIDVALNMTKAKNLHTFTTNANAGYKTEKWNTNASFSTLHSDQDDVEEIKRWDGKITYNYILGKRWYPNAMAQWLANTEQQLDLRQNIQLGMGVYLIRSNSVYWGLKGGVNDNYERYYFYDSSEPPVKYTSDNNSWEVFIASEADLFNNLSSIIKRLIIN